MNQCFVKYLDGTEELFGDASLEVTSKWVIIRRGEEIIAAVAAAHVARVAQTPHPLAQQIVPGGGREEIERWARANALPSEAPKAA